MEVNNKSKRGYLIHKFDNGQVALCRVLNEYSSEKEAKKDLFKLLADELEDKDILNKYAEKGIF
ncbi:MAG: hypothetical protein GX206_04575 [Clostridiales bacterium]|nr:hypothetical protein [Clostridiales bacterium]